MVRGQMQMIRWQAFGFRAAREVTLATYGQGPNAYH